MGRKATIPAGVRRGFIVTRALGTGVLATALAVGAVAAPGASGARAPREVTSTPLPVVAAEAKAGIVDLAAAPGGGSYAALAGFGSPAFFGLAKLEASGAADASFGDGGFAAPFTDPLASHAAAAPSMSGPEAEAVAVQPNGAVVVGGTLASRAYVAEDGNTLESFQPLLVRYRPDGSLDPTFGTGGWIEPGGGGGGVVHDVAVMPDGRIIAAVGSDVRRNASAGAPGVYAFASDGSLDASFGLDGRALVHPNGRPVADPRSIALLPDGDILVSAFRDSRPLLVRLLPDGRIDRSFGRDGFAQPVAPKARCCEHLPLAVAPDGSPTFVFASSQRQGRVLVARLRPGGGADRSFGGDGLVVLPTRFEDAYGIAVAGDDSVTVAGDVRHREGRESLFAYAVAHLAPDGRPDPSFGRRGVETLVRGIASLATAVLEQPGEVLVGGSYEGRTAVDGVHSTALLLTRRGAVPRPAVRPLRAARHQPAR